MATPSTPTATRPVSSLDPCTPTPRPKEAWKSARATPKTADRLEPSPTAARQNRAKSPKTAEPEAALAVASPKARSEVSFTQYPPPDPNEVMLRYNRWREETQPLTHMWETQALPWLTLTCQRARQAADETSKRAVVALRETLDPQARELAAQLRAHGLRPAPSVDSWWATNVHSVGVGMPPLLVSMVRGLWDEQPVAYDDPLEQREKSLLGPEDWVLTNWNVPD